jgi:hypothetical protein
MSEIRRGLPGSGDGCGEEEGGLLGEFAARALVFGRLDGADAAELGVWSSRWLRRGIAIWLRLCGGSCGLP